MAHFDVVIVGARCAGAALATFLSRQGVRTLVIDAAPLGSDMVLSTHYLHAPALDVLDDLGVGGDVRQLAPACRSFALRTDSHQVTFGYPDERAGYCLRRFRLDALLQDAARTAGAEVRGHTKLVDLVRKDGRVVGVVVETARGRETIFADLVVGADGRNSKVAELTGVEEYLGADMSRGGYWMYWPASQTWRNDERFAFDSLLAFEGEGLRYVFQTDDNLLLLVAAPPAAEARSWGRAYRERYLEYMKASPWTAPLVEGLQPVGRPVGFLKARFFLRRPIGDGFALVGDAGEFKDFVTGHGITDALLGARHLAAAVVDGRPEAFEWYWRHRDATTLPLYFDALRLGAVGANDAMMRRIVEKASGSSELRDRFGKVADRRISPLDAFEVSRLAGWSLTAALAGKFDVLSAFLRTGRAMAGFRKELAQRQRLLADAEARLAQAPVALPPARAVPGLVPNAA